MWCQYKEWVNLLSSGCIIWDLEPNFGRLYTTKLHYTKLYKQMIGVRVKLIQKFKISKKVGHSEDSDESWKKEKKKQEKAREVVQKNQNQDY